MHLQSKAGAVTVTSAASTVQTVVIGAGVIGLAVARAIALKGHEVLILDRSSSIGSETSSRNSEVVHAGLYYPKDSFKAKLCVAGRNLLFHYCSSRNIYANRCGKLVIATSEHQQKSVLMSLQKQAIDNGVDDVKMLSMQDVKFLEPSVQAPGGALWSPSTGIFDSHHFMQCLLADAESSNAILALHTKVDDAEYDNSSLQIHADGIWLRCKNVVNCGGLWANHIASLFHNGKCRQLNQTNTWTPPKAYVAKGTYFRLNRQSPGLFNHLIYPIPDAKGGLGVHATIDRSGQVKFGPDVEWLDPNQEIDSVDMSPDSDRAKLFYNAICTYWPDLSDYTLVPDYTGLRPKLSHPKLHGPDQPMPFQDFCFVGPEIHGVPGLCHLFGIESPGLTASLAIADQVVQLLRCD